MRATTLRRLVDRTGGFSLTGVLVELTAGVGSACDVERPPDVMALVDDCAEFHLQTASTMGSVRVTV